MTALATSLLTSPEGVEAFLINIPEVVATLAAIALAWKTRSFVVSFVGAVIVLYSLQALL